MTPFKTHSYPQSHIHHGCLTRIFGIGKLQSRIQLTIARMSGTK